MQKQKVAQFIIRNYGTSSKRWINRQQNDYYVKEARALGYRSRAAFKLIEMNEKHHLFTNKCHTIVELGAAPGSWTQVVSKLVQSCTIICVDLLHMDPVSTVNNNTIQYIQGDFTEPAIVQVVQTALQGNKADVILSDMAPNTCGIASLDRGRSVQLCEQALAFAKMHIKVHGNMLCKVFAG